MTSRAFTGSLLALMLCASEVPAQSFEYIGSALWNDVTDVRVAGSYAYCSFHDGLGVIDISDPATPTLVSKVLCQGRGESIDVQGGYAYMADGDSGLRIFDISNPEAAALVATWDSPAYAMGVDVQGSHAYITDWWLGLDIIDIANPAQPLWQSTFDTPDGAWDVMVQDDVAYVADAGNGLEIIDVTDPGNPAHLGHHDLGREGSATAVCVEGDYAYVALMDVAPALQIVDVSNPQNPHIVANLGDSRGYAGLWKNGNYLYLVDYAGGDLMIADVTDPEHPSFVTQWFDVADLLLAVTVQGSYAYLTCGNTARANYYTYDSGLSIVDVTDPSQPTLSGVYDARGDVRSISVVDDQAYVATVFPGFRIMDIADPANPATICSYWSRDSTGLSVDVETANGYAYATYMWQRLVVVNVQDEEHPEEAGSVSLNGDFPRLAVRGTLAFVADGAMGLRIINVANPLSPLELSTTNTPGEAADVVLDGDLAYVADGPGGFQIIDVADTLDPEIIGSCMTPFAAWSLCVANGYAYVADLNSGVQIVDITMPANPQIVGEYATPAWARGVAVDGNRLYVACAASGLLALDITEPTQPMLIAQYDTPGYAWDVVAHDGNVYVADQSGLMILHLETQEVGNRNSLRADHAELAQNYPNPFNSTTTIRFAVRGHVRVQLKIYDVLGRNVDTLVDETLRPGPHEIMWNADEFPSGIYLARLTTGQEIKTIKMALVK
jgi:hypothetical protein